MKRKLMATLKQLRRKKEREKVFNKSLWVKREKRANELTANI